MGMFSWLTADTKESIRVGEDKNVYLLQPNGKPSIVEDYYDGYGNFGGADAYIWLAKNNLPAEKLKNKTYDEIRELGIGLELGCVYKGSNGKTYSVFHKYADLVSSCVQFVGNYESPMDDFDGKTPNQLIESGDLVEIPLQDLIEYPLKFSFSEFAVYEDLPASETDPSQGFLE